MVFQIVLLLLLVLSVHAEEYIVILHKNVTFSVPQKRSSSSSSSSSVSLNDYTYTLTNVTTNDSLLDLLYLPGIRVTKNIDVFSAAAAYWNLDRIDQPFLPLDGLFNKASPETGKNVDVYIADTGVHAKHPCFTGRVLSGVNMWDSQQVDGSSDCNGHGTHVSSTIGCVDYGIATGVTIIPIKIFGCDGRGSLMALIMSTEWILHSMLERGPERKAIINLSIQSTGSEDIDEMVRTLHGADAVVVVAAGNFNEDACFYSPAREPLAVTVGATSMDDSKITVSNIGRCVDVYAPGDNIIGASPFPPTFQATKRGTSMSCPHTTGVVALLRERFPNKTNVEIITLLKQSTIPIRGGQLNGLPLLQLPPKLLIPYLKITKTIRKTVITKKKRWYFTNWIKLEKFMNVSVQTTVSNGVSFMISFTKPRLQAPGPQKNYRKLNQVFLISRDQVRYTEHGVNRFVVKRRSGFQQDLLLQKSASKTQKTEDETEPVNRQIKSSPSSLHLEIKDNVFFVNEQKMLIVDSDIFFSLTSSNQRTILIELSTSQWIYPS